MAKIGFVDCKWSNWNAQGSYTPWSHSLSRSFVNCPFHWMQEKGNAACGLKKSVNLFFKKRFHGLQMVQFECPRVIHPLVSFSSKVICGLPFSLDRCIRIVGAALSQWFQSDICLTFHYYS